MVSVRRVLARVSSSPRRTSSMMRGSDAERSPITLKRMPLPSSFSTSCSRERRNSCIRNDTSSGGRRQFSLEKAKSVRNSMPRSMQALTTSRTVSTPRRCPATRGRKRFFAQRPLPSMMMATWRGTIPVSGTACVELVNSGMSSRAALHRHQVLLFFGHEPVDVGDRLVGELLDLGLGAFVVVLAHLVLLDHGLPVPDPVAPHVLHRHLP